MTQTQNKRLTFKEYLAYDDGTHTLYRTCGWGAGANDFSQSPALRYCRISRQAVLYLEVQRLGLDWRVKLGNVDVLPQAKRSRLPDVSAIAGDVWQQIPPRASAVLTVPLLLAVEVISSDYRIDA